MQLRDNLGGQQRHIEDVEHGFERILLLEDRKRQILQSLRLVDQVLLDQVIALLDVVVTPDLGATDVAANKVGGRAQLHDVLEARGHIQDAEPGFEVRAL